MRRDKGGYTRLAHTHTHTHTHTHKHTYARTHSAAKKHRPAAHHHFTHSKPPPELNIDMCIVKRGNRTDKTLLPCLR